MATEGDSLVLYGTDLNDLTNFRLEGIDFFTKPPPERPEWATGGDSDGAVLVREPLHDNREGPIRVRVEKQASMDAALAKIGTLVDLLLEAKKNPDGIPLVWTPRGSSKSATAYVLDGEIANMPITSEGDDSGWWFNYPVLDLNLVGKPYLYLSELNTILDDFSSNTIGNYTFDTGGGTLAVSGGQLVPSSGTEKRIYLSGGTPYTSFYDAQVTWKYTTGAVVGGVEFGPTFKRLGATNYLRVVAFSTGVLFISKMDNGSLTDLTSSGGFTISPSTTYWVRARIEGNLITAEFWTSAPTATGTPTKIVTYTLTGADATKFGQGVAGNVGMRATGASDWRYDDLTIEPNVWVSTNPAVIGTLPGVPGDVPAEGRLIVTERSNQDRRFVEYGLQQRYTNLANSLLLDDGSLVTSGFAGSSGALAGAYGGTAITATLTTTPVAVCGLGNLANIGTFRVKARVRPSAATILARLSYKDGDGPLRPLPYQSMQQSGTFVELDLGVVNITQAQLGSQRFTGEIQAYDPAGAGSTLAVDHVVLVPCGEGYGKARAPVLFETPTAFLGRDEYDETAGALAGKTAPSGGNWSGAGDADDFAVEATGHTAQRTAVSDADINTGRYARLGTGTPAATLVQADFKTSFTPGAGFHQLLGVFARYTDVNNWVMATVDAFGQVATDPRDVNLIVRKRVAGTVTTLASVPVTFGLNANFTIRLVVDATGRFLLWFGPAGSLLSAPTVIGSDSALATGGAIASGGYGIYDAHTAGFAATRNFDNFLTAAPTNTAALFAGRQLEFRYDGVLRQDSTGTYDGVPPERRGSPSFLIPPAGQQNRTTRILVKADRNDIEEFEDVPLGDTLQVQVPYTPRSLVVPR